MQVFYYRDQRTLPYKMKSWAEWFKDRAANVADPLIAYADSIDNGAITVADGDEIVWDI